MLTVYNCLVTEHDLRLVLLAVIVCAFASVTAINLLSHVHKSKGRSRGLWLLVAAVATGFGIWATHFIGMLAYTSDASSGYDVALTVFSLAAAIIVTGLGMSVALVSDAKAAPWLGGAIVGGGIAVMHYTGMAAFQVAGSVLWDYGLVSASILFGLIFGAMALPLGLRSTGRLSRLCGAGFLTLAICAHHFTAMGAVSILPDSAAHISETALPTDILAVAVAAVSFAILLMAIVGLWVDLRDKSQALREMERMRELANAAVEGLILCDGEKVVSVNESLTRLSGMNDVDLSGMDLSSFVPDADIRAKLFANPETIIEAKLRHRDGKLMPVELISRTVVYNNRRHNVVAVRDLQDRKDAEAHIRFLAHHDPLTGLANRANFNQQLDWELDAHAKAGQKLAVFCLDLDRFKQINDIYGHSSGDQMLQRAAEKICSVLNERQLVARLGGDEFAIIVPNLNDPAQAGRLAEDIIEVLKGTDASADGVNAMSTSIGIALYPFDAADRTTLLSHADTALYRAKAEGRGTYRFFEFEMGLQVRERRSIEHDLRSAVALNKLNLVYQPQTCILTGETFGFEALLRWHHPERGDVSPSVFIPLAEESGLILRIGEWVLRSACTEAQGWKAPLNVAVNVSALQLTSPGFLDLVSSILQETMLDPKRLEIEITETALVRDPERALQILNHIKAMGVHIAMDDFGTGYSSLSNLRAFPFDKIKIDRSFIKAVDANPQAATIVRAILGLGKGLGLPVIAEGVETVEELRFLETEGCNEAQGYLFGKPAPIEHFGALTQNAANDVQVA